MVKITDDLIEELLNEEEGTTLDFKKGQYPFSGASDDQKGELLKDILAFANAWRRTDSYILRGVEEVKGGKSIVVGIDHHLDDAQLQQFVNNKTQYPLTFSYVPYQFEGKQIGIICVPLQQRPLFVKKDYGKLNKNTVYIKRGSSTDIAYPDEVARMGAETAFVLPKNEPFIKVTFLDSENNSLDNLKVASIDALDKKEILKHLMKIQLSDDELQLLERCKNELDEIADTYPNCKIHYPYKVEQAVKFKEKIDSLMKLVNSDFEEFQRRYDLLERSFEIAKAPEPEIQSQISLCPSFVALKISNDGKCPAENVTVYVAPLNGANFFTKEKLIKLNVMHPLKKPERIENIINLAKKLDGNNYEIKEWFKIKSRDALIRGSHTSMFDNRFFNLFNSNTNSQKSVTVGLEENTLKVHLHESLMHNHYTTTVEQGIYLSPFLKKGEKAQIEYTCHANNLPEPSKGFLTLEGI